VPVFQDVDTVKAWELHGISKDDFLIYDKDGKLLYYLSISGPTDTVLQSDAGFKAVLDLLLQVAK
jgi:hypothetical protein